MACVCRAYSTYAADRGWWVTGSGISRGRHILNQRVLTWPNGYIPLWHGQKFSLDGHSFCYNSVLSIFLLISEDASLSLPVNNRSNRELAPTPHVQFRRAAAWAGHAQGVEERLLAPLFYSSNVIWRRPQISQSRTDPMTGGSQSATGRRGTCRK